MRRNTIVISGHHNYSQELISAAFAIFSPIITVVDRRFASSFDNENRLMWEIKDFSGDGSSRLYVAWIGPSEREGVLEHKGSACINLTCEGSLLCNRGCPMSSDEAAEYILMQILKHHPAKLLSQILTA
jgi:hypothetical protein